METCTDTWLTSRVYESGRPPCLILDFPWREDPHQLAQMPSYADSRQPQGLPAIAVRKARLWRLPIPNLQQTLDRYLSSLTPFLLDDEQAGGESFEDSYGRQRKLCQTFLESDGNVLQQRLRILDKQSPHNWLDDNIWLKFYHQWRVPLVVNSNWWAAFRNDTNIPRDILSGVYDHDDLFCTGLTKWQVYRAAWLAHRALTFKFKVDRQELHPETTPEGAWLQSTFRRMYNTSRLPRPDCDTLSEAPPPSSRTLCGVLLNIHDWFYIIEALDENGEPLSAHEIGKRLVAVIRDVAERLAKGERAEPIGVLSADERDRWAENQKHLLDISPQNRDTLEAINHSILALSLDHYTYVSPPALPTPPPSPSLSYPGTQIKPDTPSEIEDHLRNLRSAHPDRPAHNRWFDKTFTIVVEANTRAGAMGEHSPVDALAPNVLGEYICDEGVDASCFGDLGDHCEGVSGWRRLDWVVDDRIRAECIDAEDRAREIVHNSDIALLVYDAYGREYIRNKAGLPSDAYIQMAIQLAYYKVHNAFTATYETASTRAFENGRTEAIRSLTKDSRAWVLAMADPSVPPETRHALLHTATKTHTTLSRAAAAGQGIDRHLLGLRTMRVPWDGAPPALFTDALYARSAAWGLSTSSMGAAPNLRGTGFGAVVEDGYGINYIVKPHTVTLGIESKHSCPKTSSRALANALREALDEMRDLCARFPPPPRVDERAKVRKEMAEFLQKMKEDR